MSCFNESTGFTGGGGWAGGTGGGSGFGGSGGDWSAPLHYLPGTSSGYKNDGRGTWVDNGTHNIRHSVDLLSDGTIQEHVVITEKSSGRWIIRDADFK